MADYLYISQYFLKQEVFYECFSMPDNKNRKADGSHRRL